MILKIFAVYDQAADAYLMPFFDHNRGRALRGFSELVNSPDHQFGKYAADFTLFEIGAWNDEDCIFDMYTSKVNLGTALEFKESENAPSISDVAQLQSGTASGNSAE